MKKLELPNVTLIALTNKDFEGHKKAIDKSCEGIEFGAVKLIWDEKITSIDEWNRKIVFELHNYVDTSHALLIHGDGYVINPHIWEQKYTGELQAFLKGYYPDKFPNSYRLGELWMNYDYVGAPWPLPKDDYSYRTPEGEIIRVGNSVSLRSKKLMQIPSTHNLEWKEYYGNTNEDGYLCVHQRKWLEMQGCKFAPLEVAIHFSKEHEIPENVGLSTFAFHSL